MTRATDRLTPSWQWTITTAASLDPSAPSTKATTSGKCLSRFSEGESNTRSRLTSATDAAAQGAVYYQILEPQRAGDALDEVDALVQREAREGLATLLLSVAANDSAMLASQLKTELNQRLAALGLRVTRCKLELTEAA